MPCGTPPRHPRSGGRAVNSRAGNSLTANLRKSQNPRRRVVGARLSMATSKTHPTDRESLQGRSPPHEHREPTSRRSSNTCAGLERNSLRRSADRPVGRGRGAARWSAAGYFDEAVRRLLWFVTLAEGRVEQAE